MVDSLYLLSFFKWLNNDVLAIPSAFLFFGASIFFTIKTKFLQLRVMPLFIRVIRTHRSSTKQEQNKNQRQDNNGQTDSSFGNAINPLHALFTALGTSIGVGNIVGPGIAIVAGGPGALFWLVFYLVCASATKFAEVMFALHTRTKNNNNEIIGGPMNYLKSVHSFLAYWYAVIMAVLLIGFSAVQSNTLSSIYAIEHIPTWVTGFILAIVTAITIHGGVKRIGLVASKVVPFMFVLYVLFSLFILGKNPVALWDAVKLVFGSILQPAAPIGGFLGATVFQAMHSGMLRGVFISESGIGTASMAHAMADVKNHSDQGVLAMGSTVADILLSVISGLLTLVTGIWMRGGLSNTLVYEVFKIHTPVAGHYILLVSISLFVFTTVIGNSFNGLQNFRFLSKGVGIAGYKLLLLSFIFIGAILPVPLVWEIMDTILVLAAVPNLLGLMYLAHKYPDVLKV